MKKLKTLFVVLFILSFCVIGCLMTPVPYSFTENDTASITFTRTITLINLDGEKLPDAKSATYWSPILIPADKKLNFRLRIDDSSVMDLAGSSSGWAIFLLPFAPMIDVNLVNVSFYCPPLEAGREYQLSVRNGFMTFGRKLVLTDKESGTKVYEQMF
jgi:hypothetical protein